MALVSHNIPRDDRSVPVEPPYEALGQSDAFLGFEEHISRAAQADRPVLLIGERGSGKEYAAFRLHFLSRRWQRPFLTLNCAALPPGLIESELFGHEAGAFTGALNRRAGRFEAANEGTLFLDELGAIPLEVQAKLLRAVEYGVFERVGSSRTSRVDVRIIGATNANLRALAQQGRFKEDLLDRLSFEVIFVPPLRERGEDILVLARHFAARMALELGRDETPVFSDEMEAALEAYPWPGNIRELRNVVERAVYRAEDARITAVAFDPFQRQPDDAHFPGNANPAVTAPPASPDRIAAPPPFPCSFQEAVADYEVSLLQNALVQARYHQRRAAALLGLNYDQFRGLYRKYQSRLTQ